MDIVYEAITQDNIDDSIKMFDDNFYFLTSYPAAISTDELKNFLLSYGTGWNITMKNETIGLLYCIVYNPEYVFFKLKLKKYNEDEKIFEYILKESIKRIKSNTKGVKRLETILYEPEKREIKYFNDFHIKCEVYKKNEIYIKGCFYGTYTYSLTGEEITEFLNSNYKNIEIGRYENNRELISQVINQNNIFCILDNANIFVKDDLEKSILDKRRFPFIINQNNNIIGTVCLDNIDWENRVCQIKIGICKNNKEFINEADDMKKIIDFITEFSKNTLRLNKIWGLWDAETKYAGEIIKQTFDNEGQTISKKLQYLACIFE